jgi:hypothetical protein
MRLVSSITTVGACAALLVIAACSKMIETAPLQPGPLGYAPTCSSALGAYYLPKTYLKVKASTDGSSIKLDSLVPVRSADRTQPLCLDYLALPNADDVIRVKRYPNGLLESVTSSAIDKTPEIVEALVETGANLAIAAGRGTMLQAGDTVELEFDPFVWSELMAARSALRRFGICIYVEGYTFPADGLSPAALRIAGERWCSASQPKPFETDAHYYAALPVPPDVMKSGILYRPDVSHRIIVLRKNDPDGPGSWKLHQSTRIDMPNLGPILAVGVERAMFATRETDLSFNKGVLTDVSVNKTSELVGFVRIPLAVAKAVVSVPAQIIQIRITDTQNQTALLNAQGQLANTLAQIRRDNEGRRADVSDQRSLDGAGFIGRCTNAGGDEAMCARMARTQQ